METPDLNDLKLTDIPTEHEIATWLQDLKHGKTDVASLSVKLRYRMLGIANERDRFRSLVKSFMARGVAIERTMREAHQMLQDFKGRVGV